MLPLYGDLINLGMEILVPTSHPGLVFEKFVDRWESPPKTKPKEGAKQDFYQQIAERMVNGTLAKLVNSRLDAAHERRRKLVVARGGRLYTAKSASRLIICLGSGHPLEAGFTWHPTLGVPFLSGSSIKGMIRALADPRQDDAGNSLGWGDPAKWTANVRRLFGDIDDLGAGSIIVFDAIPLRCPELALDVMTPHYGPYYGDPRHHPPADWHNPTPIPFLAVAEDQQFEFALAPRSPSSTTRSDDLKTASDYLKRALAELGLGGKTAVGYGRFEQFIDRTDEDRNRQ